MPTEQVAHTMIEMAKVSKQEMISLEPKDIWQI
jgi:hypothetical protein